jgi:hypothetical protein
MAKWRTRSSVCRTARHAVGIHQHVRPPRVVQRLAGVLGEGGHQDAVYLLALQHLQVESLFLGGAVGIAQDDVVALFIGAVFHRPREAAVQGVTDVDEDQADGMGAALAETGRQAVGAVAAASGRFLDAFSGLVADSRVAGERPRHAGRGEVELFRQLFLRHPTHGRPRRSRNLCNPMNRSSGPKTDRSAQDRRIIAGFGGKIKGLTRIRAPNLAVRPRKGRAFGGQTFREPKSMQSDAQTDRTFDAFENLKSPMAKGLLVQRFPPSQTANGMLTTTPGWAIVTSPASTAAMISATDLSSRALA